MSISISERAVTELKDLMAGQEKADAALRVWVAGGGCSGLQYGMALDDGKPEEGEAQAGGGGCGSCGCGSGG